MLMMSVTLRYGDIKGCQVLLINEHNDVKLFKFNVEIITYCQQQFSFDLPSVLWSTFHLKFDNTDNLFCRLCSH